MSERLLDIDRELHRLLREIQVRHQQISVLTEAFNPRLLAAAWWPYNFNPIDRVRRGPAPITHYPDFVTALHHRTQGCVHGGF